MISMKQRILDHLLKFGTITTWEAIRDYGCTRISEYIRQLRADGHLIINVTEKGTNRYGEKTNWVRYTLERKEK